MLQTTAFTPSSVILKSHHQHHSHLFLATTFSVSSFPRAAPLQLRLRDEENDDQHIKNNVVNLLFPAPIFLLASAFASICTIWSEYSEIATGCGPRSLPDALERGSYLGVLVVAGLSVFVRIVSGQRLSDVYAKETSKTTGMGLFAVENLSLLAVVGAFVAVWLQSLKEEQMDGL
ncbi:hypothetical protein ACHAXM_007000 [Skeletonema potamos]|jgi:hypothetical protein